MRADRLLSLLWLLKGSSTVTAPQAAAALEVSVRTVYRDVEALSAAGVPVYCEPGRGGGIRLMPGFRTDVTGLSEAEGAALLTAIGGDTSAPGMSVPLAGALRKVTAALPDAGRAAALRVRDRVYLGAPGWLPSAADAALEPLHDAVLAGRRVRLQYRPAAGAAGPRTLDPLGLVCAAGAWYLVALHRGAERVYRVSRCRDVEVLADAATRPEGFDVRVAWGRYRDRFHAEQEPVTVRLAIAPEHLASLADLAPAPVVDALAAGVPVATMPVSDASAAGVPVEAPSPERPHGWTLVAVQFGDRRHAIGVITSLGSGAIVLDPPWARAVIVDAAKAVLARYS